jgi:hypothetical protein
MTIKQLECKGVFEKKIGKKIIHRIGKLWAIILQISCFVAKKNASTGCSSKIEA